MSPKPEARDAGRLDREREHHREIAPRAEAVWNWDSPTGRVRARRRAAFFAEHAGLRPGVRALEVGCGTGLFLERALATGASVAAIDLSTELLGLLRARAAGTPLLCCGDVGRLPYRDGAFDAAYGSSILHHLELAPALGEIRRVLRPGGRLVFAEPNLLNPHIAFTYLVGPRSFFGLSPDEMAFTRSLAARLLREAGFAEVRVEPYDFLYPLVPTSLIPAVSRLGARLERTPLVREIAGSLLLRAVRP